MIILGIAAADRNIHIETVEAIAKMIGVDSLGYLPKESLSQLIGGKNFCSACFDGQYPTEIPKNTCKNRFEQKLSERKK